jgi:hypothetical protein
MALAVNELNFRYWRIAAEILIGMPLVGFHGGHDGGQA